MNNMSENSKPYTFDRVVRIIITLTVLFLLFLLLKKVSKVLLPFLVGWLLAYLLQPIVHFFQYKLKFKSRLLSVIVTLLLFIGFFVGLGFILVPIIIDETRTVVGLINSYIQRTDVNAILPLAWQNQLKEFLSRFDLQTLVQSENFLSILKKVLPGVWNFVSGSFNFILSWAVLIIVFLYLFFILMDYERISTKWIELVPQKYRSMVWQIVQDIEDGMNRYFRGQALVAMCVGILHMIGLSIIGLPMSILMGLTIGILNLVPYLELLGIIPCFFLAVLKSAETGQNFWLVVLSIAIVWLTVQAIQDLILVPKIMGKVTGLHPALILLSLSIWGALLGLAGMIIALPITSLILSYYRRFIVLDEKRAKQSETFNEEWISKRKDKDDSSSS
jgi:predicted PurR-regulated permease PerM